MYRDTPDLVSRSPQSKYTKLALKNPHRTTPPGHFARNQGNKKPIVSLGTPTPRARNPTPTPRAHPSRKRVKVLSGKVRVSKPDGKPPTENDWGVLFRWVLQYHVSFVNLHNI